jgi:hypothetical protein
MCLSQDQCRHTMEFNRRHFCGPDSAITVTTKIIRSESPLRERSSGPKYRPEDEEVEQGQYKTAKAASRAKLGSKTVSTSIRAAGHHEPCASPVIYDQRIHKVLPPVTLQSGFEESPEWRQHYDPSSKLAETDGPYLLGDQSRLLPPQSLTTAKNFSTETIITAKSLSGHSSIDTAKLGSRNLLCLRRPPSSRNLLKAGNIRLKKLIRPKSKTYFRTQSVPEDEHDIAGRLQKLDLTASKKDLPRRRSKSRIERIANDEVTSSRKTIRNEESSASIVDLDQVEARHGLEKYHRTTLSRSWDEIFKSMGGFRTDSTAGDSNHHHQGPQLHVADFEVNKRDLPGTSTSPSKHETNKRDLPGTSTSPSKHETNESRNSSRKSPPLPGPRTSSFAAMVNGSPTGQKFQVVVAELPAQSTPTRQSKPQSANEDHPTESSMNFLQAEESLKPRMREGRSLEGLSKFGPAPDASQSTIALEAIEAEMNNGRPLSPSTLTELTQPFSINCTPPQPVTAPTDPPIGPLPELPEFDRADAASRTSSHHSSSTRLSRPTVPPRSHHRRNPSSKSTSSNLTLRAMNSPKGHHRKHTSISDRSPKKVISIKCAQNVPTEGMSNRMPPQPRLALSVSSNTNITEFNQYNLGSSQDLRSPAAGEIGQENDMVDGFEIASAQSPTLSNDMLSSRSNHTKGLKLRDLAEEKATRVRGRHQGRGLDDAIVVEKPSFTAEEEKTSPNPQLSHFPPVPGRTSDSSHDSHSGLPPPASRQDSVNRCPSYQSRRSSSNRTSQKTTRPIMNQSQIMVLAETNPDTQMFRASTPTGSIRRADSKKADSVITSRERKVRRRKSKASVCSHAHQTAAQKGIAGIKPNGQHTPPLSDPSTHSSDDEAIESMRRSKSRRGINHIAALVKEDSDLESAPSKRAVAALARKEEKKYFKEQLLLRKLKRESSELKLAMRLLSRGLEKLSMFVEADEELDEWRGHGLIEAEMEPVRGMAERFQRSLSPEDLERFDQVHSTNGNTRKDVQNDQDPGFHRAKSERTKANDARPISLVSRYSSVRNGMGESVIAGPPIKDEVIWDQVDGLNRRR